MSGVLPWVLPITLGAASAGGTASGSRSYVGAASGSRSSSGSCSGGYAYAGSAGSTGASGVLPWTLPTRLGAAGGHANGTCSGGYGYASSSAGFRSPKGTSSGAYGFASATTGVGHFAFSRVLAKLNTYQSVVIQIVGDSTSVGYMDGASLHGWVGRFGTGLGVGFDVNVLHSQWDDSTQAYDTATTIHSSTRSGAPTIRVMNGSALGKAFNYFDDPVRRPKMLSTPGADVVIIADGINENGSPSDFLTAYLSYLANVGAALPGVPIIVTTENPVTLTTEVWGGGYVYTDLWAAMKSTLSSQPVDLLDTQQAFTSLGTQLNSDGIHPTATGYADQANWMLARLAPNMTPISGVYGYGSGAAGSSVRNSSATAAYGWAAHGGSFTVSDATLPWSLPIVLGVNAGSAGAGAGNLSYSASGSGSAVHAGSTVGGYAYAGSATGFDVRGGQATGAYGYVGSAVGVNGDSGIAAGSYAYAGSAVGFDTRAGAAAGGYSYAGSASGDAATVGGQSSGALHWTATSHGASVKSGHSVGRYGWVMRGDPVGGSELRTFVVPPISRIVKVV